MPGLDGMACVGRLATLGGYVGHMAIMAPLYRRCLISVVRWSARCPPLPTAGQQATRTPQQAAAGAPRRRSRRPPFPRNEGGELALELALESEGVGAEVARCCTCNDCARLVLFWRLYCGQGAGRAAEVPSGRGDFQALFAPSKGERGIGAERWWPTFGHRFRLANHHLSVHSRSFYTHVIALQSPYELPLARNWNRETGTANGR